MDTHHYQGVWPVMITPFTADGEIDYASLERLIAWYEQGGATGLFAACQSSEIFYLSLRERVELVRFVKQHAHVPVIASGHIFRINRSDRRTAKHMPNRCGCLDPNHQPAV